MTVWSDLAEGMHMARVNLERRAEIGLAKRNRTRAAILEAARACYAAPDGRAGNRGGGDAGRWAREGHLLRALRGPGGPGGGARQGLIEELDRRLQPARLAADHPLTRVATGVTVLLRDLARTPARHGS